ncbi:hypothetical protein [Parashewanella hymeniacidonis]|uniref:hypothetical protein n=1 Tax=Parashewanella hymeniacidonis TaxID=2807618 RepID=UPI001960F406|nr:hypothetical protein [Parashewanella hymeniacidonis]
MKKYNFRDQQRLNNHISNKHNRTSGVLFDHVEDAYLVHIAIHPGMSHAYHYYKEGADVFKYCP